MRHGKKIHKMSRPAEHRRATLNNLAMALITHKQIQTTDTRAKALKPYIDRLISTASQNTLHARRLVAQSLPDKEAFKELFNVIVPKLEGRTSGFSRIVKHRTRKGDGAQLSIIQLLVEKEEAEKGKKKGKKKARGKAEAVPKKEKAAEAKEEAAKTPAEEPKAPEAGAASDVPEEEIIAEVPEDEEGQEPSEEEEK